MNKKTADRLRLAPKDELALPKWDLYGANMSKLIMTKRYNISFSIPHTTTRVTFPFIIIDGLKQDVIVGTDLMHALNISLDHGSKKVLIGKKSSQTPAPWEFKIHAHKHLSVGARAEHLFFIPTTPSLLPNKEVYVEAQELPEGFHLQSGMATTTLNGHVPVIIANVSHNDLKLPRRTHLATCSPASQVTQLDLHPEIPERKPIYKISPEEIIQKIDLSKIPAEFIGQVKALVIEYRDIFARDKLDVGNCTILPHVIRLQDPTKIINQPPYRWPYALTKTVHDYVDNLLKSGVIRHSTSPFSSPLMIIRKASASPMEPINDQYRVVHNYKRINDNILACSYPLRNLHELLDYVAAGKIHSVIDLSQGYFNQQVIDPHGATAFSVPGKGLFEYTKSPMGINSSPAYFQRLLDFVVRGIPNIYVYLDDIICSTKTWPAHITGLKQTFDRLRRYQLKCNMKKVTLGACEVNYLGYNISASHGVRPGARKTEELLAFLPPKTKTEIKSFLGLCSFFRKCVPRFSDLAAPLNNLIKEDSGYKSGPLPPAALQAFRDVQQALSTRPCIAPVDFDREFILTVDSSNYAHGAILSQKNVDGIEHPCAFASKMLSDPQKKKPAFQREKEGIRWGMKHFRPYLLGREFLVRTDHKPLVSLAKGVVEVTDSVSADIQNYRPFRVEYLPGSKMPADYLSRAVYKITYGNKAPHGAKAVDNNIEATPFCIQEHPGFPLMSKVDFKTAQKNDNNIKALACFYKWKIFPQHTILNAYVHIMASGFQLDADGIVRDKKGRLLIPNTLRSRVLFMAHDKWGHPGIERLGDIIKEYFTWPNMKSDIINYVNSCVICSKTKPPHAYTITKNEEFPEAKFFNDRLHADCLTNLTLDPINHFKSVFVLVDAFSGFILARAITSPSAAEILRVLTQDWLPAHGIPNTIISDNGSEFANQAVKQACSDLQIEHRFTSPGHSRSNGTAERSIRSLVQYLRLYVGGKLGHLKSSWPNYLAPYCLIANSTTTYRGFSPFYLSSGITPKLPWHSWCHARPNYGDNDWADWANIYSDAAKRVQQKLKDSRLSHTVTGNYSSTADKFAPGSLVYLYAGDNNTKLDRKFGGPYLVLKHLPPHVTIQRLRGHTAPFQVHQDSLRAGAWRHPHLRLLDEAHEDGGRYQPAPVPLSSVPRPTTPRELAETVPDSELFDEEPDSNRPPAHPLAGHPQLPAVQGAGPAPPGAVSAQAPPAGPVTRTKTRAGAQLLPLDPNIDRVGRRSHRRGEQEGAAGPSRTRSPSSASTVRSQV